MSDLTATLLIIDDDEIVRLSLADYLEDSGFRVVQAASAALGLEMFDSEHPDLVISDLRMPQMGGLELVRRLMDRRANVPVIIVSGAGVMSDAVEALRLGASDYLVKPIEDLAVLEHSVRRALDRYRLIQENQRYREHLETANRSLQASLRLLQEDQDAGRHVQMNMLPTTPWVYEGFQFSHHIIPSLYLSGDFVDYFRVDDRRIAFYLADVSGHGASSAFVTVLLKFMTTRLLYESRRHGNNGIPPEFKPSDVLSHINRGLINCHLGKHVTMVGGLIELDKNKLHYSLGGHLPMPLFYAQGKAQYLTGRGLPVGLFAEAAYADYELDIAGDFSLMLASDGVLELLSEASLAEKEQALLDAFVQASGCLERLAEHFGLAHLSDMPDDIALLVLSRNSV